jgi:hypothetical protein
MRTENEYLVKIAGKLANSLPAVETFLALSSLAGFLLKYFNIGIGGIILVISLGALAIVYFLLAFKSIEPETGAVKIFVNKLIYWGLSVCVLGILFRIQNYPGFNNMIIIGSITLFFTVIYSLIKEAGNERRLVIRVIIILIIGLSLFFTPAEKLSELNIIHQVENTSTP